MKKVLIIVSALAVALVVSVNINLNMQKSSLTGLALMNLEALAGESGSGESGEKPKNIYEYTVWELDVCHVLVGGAYAKGKKVTCHSGTVHPVCVICKL